MILTTSLKLPAGLPTGTFPFAISLIPIFRDPMHALEIRLGDRKSTVAAIHTMIAKGGTPSHARNHPSGARIEWG